MDLQDLQDKQGSMGSGFLGPVDIPVEKATLSGWLVSTNPDRDSNGSGTETRIKKSAASFSFCSQGHKPLAWICPDWHPRIGFQEYKNHGQCDQG